ncbi:outer membrane protein, adhesin transport system [Maridesulfovibrio ferrireducens]|uniref:Outer membrane protein, adhesin transport system n=1 Tax=Maridesulfovibrio ferrireducens TaxID=246191 RepID=A0A1G9K7B0_9BACT|nr:TolC family outer membrane protein [Maridesulfovibrio ferrireducens]SDL45651.1 outer membrane protein, adhesin transport system [Maridesulfovibrio ferrireducens]
MKKTILLILILTLFTFNIAHAEIDGTVSLKESVIEAVKQHPKIKSLLFNRQAVDETLSAALGRFFPSLDASSSVGLQNYDSAATRTLNRNTDSNGASDNSLTLTQNIFDGMERISQYDREKARLESAKQRLFDNVETVALDAIRTHINVLRERKLMSLAEKNIQDHQDVLSNISERVTAGAGNRADEMQAKGRVARAEITLVTYTGDLQTVEAEYLRVVGKRPKALAPTEYMESMAPTTMDSVLSQTLENNPKIKVAKAEISVAEESKGVIQARMYPDVNLKLSSRYTDQLDGSKTYLQDNRAMVGISWNLFSGGTDYKDAKAADSRVKEVEADLQDTSDDLTRQVATAWSEFQTASHQIRLHEEALQYSIESRDMYLMQFNVGQRSLLDVLDAINEVFSNSVLLETARSNQIFSIYKFLTLQGTLVNTLEVATATYDTIPE